GEAFKVRNGGKLWRIEMTLTELPYGAKPFGTALAAPAQAPAPPAKGAAPPLPCYRQCLSDLLVQVLQAIADHPPAQAPPAANVRYSENGQALKLGDGLWGTATAVAMPGDGLSSLGPSLAAYKLLLADATTGQAACLCAVNENGTHGMLLLRIKAAAGKVSE